MGHSVLMGDAPATPRLHHDVFVAAERNGGGPAAEKSIELVRCCEAMQKSCVGFAPMSSIELLQVVRRVAQILRKDGKWDV